MGSVNRLFTFTTVTLLYFTIINYYEFSKSISHGIRPKFGYLWDQHDLLIHELNSRGTPWEQFLDTALLSTAKAVLVPFGKKNPNGNVTVNNDYHRQIIEAN